MSEATEQFVELMGRHFEEEGVPRIAGRLFGRLMLMARECCLDELAERLQVSKGSVSSNARLLEEWGVAKRITRPGDRRDYYRIAPDLSERLVRRQVVRLELFIQRITESRRRMGDLPPEVDARFDDTIDFNELAIRSLWGLGEQVAHRRRGG